MTITHPGPETTNVPAARTRLAGRARVRVATEDGISAALRMTPLDAKQLVERSTGMTAVEGLGESA